MSSFPYPIVHIRRKQRSQTMSSPSPHDSDYDETYDSDSDCISVNSTPPMPPPFSPVATPETPEETTLDDAFPCPPPNKSNSRNQDNSAMVLGMIVDYFLCLSSYTHISFIVQRILTIWDHQH